MNNQSEQEILIALKNGKIDLKGEFLWGSNYTFLTQIEYEGTSLSAVYKPSRGERPLWDFPTASLGKRETAAYVVSRAIGWNFVPPTIYRKKAPIGAGSIQLFIDHDPEYHYFRFNEEDLNKLHPVVLFDILINNADRKGSHILRDPDGRLWLIDHGVCFHIEDKLRTVIWDYAGEPIPDALCSDLHDLRLQIEQDADHSMLVGELLEYISTAEIRALTRRIDSLLSSGVFPEPDIYQRPFPWPQI